MELQAPTVSVLERLIRYAVRAHADINDFAMTKDRFQGTFLQCAVYENNLALIKLLLENGVQVNMLNKHGLTALHVAARRSNEAVVRMLLLAGADPLLVAHTGNTALHDACSAGYEDVVIVLLDGKVASLIDLQNNQGATALHCAVEEDHYTIVDLLIKCGADLNVADHSNREGLSNGNTALHKAARSNRIDIVNALLHAGARYDVRNDRGDTCIDVAEKYTKNLIEVFNQHKITLDSPRSLLVAAIRNDVTMLTFLEEHGSAISDVRFTYTNALDCTYSDVTLLHAAIIAGHDEVVRYVVKKGCDSAALAGCIEFACCKVYTRNVAVPLIEQDKTLALHNRVVKFVSREKYDITLDDYLKTACGVMPVIKQVPALVIAAMFAGEAIVDLLLQAGVDINAQSFEGFTALHIAAHWGRFDIVDRLLRAGADRNVTDTLGRTAYDLTLLGERHSCYKSNNFKVAEGCGRGYKSGRFAVPGGYTKVMELLAGSKE